MKKSDIMYNLNVNLAASAANAVNSLLVESTCTTPRTPEILNSLIAMTNPMDNYPFQNNNNNNNNNKNNSIKTSARPPTNMSSDSNSSSSSQMESPTGNNPPSVQHTCSELIKAGLKHSIEQKRKHHQSSDDCEDLLDLDKCAPSRSKRIKKNECSESEDDPNRQDGMHNWTWYENDDYSKLTPEDEERRRRRRERNKIAATKCRLKKREKTANLVSESEILETQNVDLKGQLQELQNQKRTLMDMLSAHRPRCQHNIGPATRDSLYRLPSVASVIDTHSYSRPASVEPNFRSQNLDNVAYNNRPASVGIPNNNGTNFSRTNLNYTKPPSIIVEEASGECHYEPQLTNLDINSDINFHYNSQCHRYPGNQYNTTMDNGCMA